MMKKGSLLLLISLVYSSYGCTSAPVTMEGPDEALHRQIVKNIDDGITLLEEAENNICKIQLLLQDARVLAVKSANEVYINHERDLLNAEFISIFDEISRRIDDEKINSISMLNASSSRRPKYLYITVSPKSPALRLDLPQLTPEIYDIASPKKCDLARNMTHTGVVILNQKNIVQVGTSDDAYKSVTALDAALQKLSFERARPGTFFNRLIFCKKIEECVAKKEIESINNVVREIEKRVMLLVTQSANGIYNHHDRRMIQLEVHELAEELRRIFVVHGIDSPFNTILAGTEEIATAEAAEKLLLQLESAIPTGK